MQNKPFAMTVSLTNAAANLLYPGTRDGSTRAAVGWIPLGDPYLLMKHIRATNTDSSARTIRLAVTTTGGAPSATNAFAWYDYSIQANSFVDWYGSFRLDGANTGHYLTGLASVTAVVMLHIEGEIGIA